MSTRAISDIQAADTLVTKLNGAKGTPDLDLRGHGNYHGKPNAEFKKYFLDQSLMWISNAQEITDKASESNWVPVSFRFGKEKCPSCLKPIKLECNGTQLRSTTECIYAKGIPPLELTLNIPSGKMVVANDLRDLFPIATDYDVNYTLNQHALSKDYCKAGMVHVFVGNTCPALYQMDRPGKKFELGGSGISKRSRKKLDSVCTDLWWVSIADHDAFIKAGGKLDDSCFIVNCVPGTYKFVHNYSNDAVTYTQISWEGQATAPVDYKAAYNAMDYTLGEVLAAFDKHWDSYLSTFPGGKTGRIQRMLDHIFFTLGNGIDFHPNGWAQVTKMPEKSGKPLPSLEIPTLTKAYNWYPCCTYSAIANLANIHNPAHRYSKNVARLNPSFWRGLVMCLQTIVQYGISREDYGRETIYIAPACLDGMMLEYPELVATEDKDFVKAHPHVTGARERYLKTQELENAINAAVAKEYPAAHNISAHGISHTGEPTKNELTLTLYPLGHSAYHKPPDYKLVSPYEGAPMPIKYTIELKTSPDGLVVAFVDRVLGFEEAMNILPPFVLTKISLLPVWEQLTAKAPQTA